MALDLGHFEKIRAIATASRLVAIGGEPAPQSAAREQCAADGEASAAAHLPDQPAGHAGSPKLGRAHGAAMAAPL